MDEIFMAKAYEEMSNSMAFKDFLQWADDKVEEAELIAATLKPEHREHFQAYFSAWQERKKFVSELKQRLEDCKSLIKEHHERPEYGDPVSDPNPYPLPGY
jgi:hypothetical protein